MRLCVVVLTLLTALALPAAAKATAGGPDRDAQVQLAFRRAQHLRHGINASEWFAQSGDYSAARTNRYTDASDIALMAHLGFDNVRLSIDASPLTEDPLGKDGLNDEFVGRLDRAVDAMLANGMAVQIDLHPQDSYKQQLRSGDYAVDQLVLLWSKLAAHFAPRDPDRIFFEVLNEPEVDDPYRWAGIQERVAAAIRQAAPRNTIIATGANYSNIPDLLAMQPLADGNVIYNFHFYEPHQFTHQGATWALTWWRYTHNIPYPATEADMQEKLAQAPDLASRYQLEEYFLDGWDAHRIRALVDEAAAWGRDHHVPLISNEFGVYREFSDPISRSNWIHDVRTAFEADGIGWAMWDYRGGFGVVTKQDGQPAQVDGAIVGALGLTAR